MFPDLVLAGLELCGAFRVPAGKEALFQRMPLTNVDTLTSYIERCGGMFGTVEAKRAILYIADGSESPMEAKLTIVFCFPIRLGGYGLPMPVLNRKIPTTDEIRKATGRSSFRCDLLWPEAGVAVEYDGNQHKERVGSDTIRRTALSELGIKEHIVVTMEQMRNQEQLDLIVKRLRRLLGIRKKATACDWSDARNDLRIQLNLTPTE